MYLNSRIYGCNFPSSLRGCPFSLLQRSNRVLLYNLGPTLKEVILKAIKIVVVYTVLPRRSINSILMP